MPSDQRDFAARDFSMSPRPYMRLEAFQAAAGQVQVTVMVNEMITTTGLGLTLGEALMNAGGALCGLRVMPRLPMVPEAEEADDAAS